VQAMRGGALGALAARGEPREIKRQFKQLQRD
jgi:hypothetical protein